MIHTEIELFASKAFSKIQINFDIDDRHKNLRLVMRHFDEILVVLIESMYAYQSQLLGLYPIAGFNQRIDQGKV